MRRELPGPTAPHSENYLWGVALVVSLTGVIWKAHALQCYTCLEPMSAPLCVTISNCSTDDIVCKTVMYSREEVYPFVGDSTVVKSCAQKCIPSDVDEIGSSRPTFCCNSDLCNLDGAVSIQISYMVMGISASFLCVLLRTGL
uniref:LY6/PLAUR domain containing 2 n=1 Tax=Gopherus evgoodei TaxID=1825980 RepID=A0A8C4YFT7_9SAUR